MSHLIDWKSVIRETVTSGITPGSKFFLVGEFEHESVRVDKCKEGFYFTNNNRFTLVTTKARLQEGYIRQQNKTLPECGQIFPSDSITNLGYIGSWKSTKKNVWLIHHLKEHQTYLVDFDLQRKEYYSLWLTCMGENLYYFRDELVTVSMWDEFLEKFSDRWGECWITPLTVSATFSGIHSVLSARNLGLIFFYNLESKVFTVLDVDDLKLYSEDEFFSNYWLPVKRDVFNEAWVNTVDGLLYVLLRKGNTHQLIFHR